MSEYFLNREIKALQGDLNMSKMAVNSVQREMLAQLKGKMGEDMKAVLNGERLVKAGFVEQKKHKIGSWFKRLFRKF